MNKKARYETKKYLHFGKRIGYDQKIDSYVNNPNKIKEHSFFPLIHYISKSEKYNDPDKLDEMGKLKSGRPVKSKKRNIMYASHLDNFVYKHYGEKLNNHYNSWTHRNNIDHCSTAYRYREEEKGKSNIDFAAEVIDNISKSNECFIMIGDFEKFFETLDHTLLKRRVAEVLEVGGLSDDWYKVFKSVTRYSYYNKQLLNQQLGTDKQIKKHKQLAYFANEKDFREFRKKHKVNRNSKKYGIPQGTALSAVLSNVYTTQFDIAVHNLIKKYNGIYRRYSDDFIVVIPKTDQNAIDLDEFRRIEDNIIKYIDKYKLKIQKEKTELYHFLNGKIININTEKKSTIDYLGFIFDGENVEMRGKSPYKFYRNAYKLIKRGKRVQAKKKLRKIPYRRQLYRLYTDMGVRREPYGNFITYAMNSQEIFDRISPNTNNLMLHQIKNRRKNIEKKLGARLNIRT